MRKLGWFSLAFAAACLLFCLLRAPDACIAVGAALALAAIGLRLHRGAWTRLLLAALGLSVGLAWSACYDLLFCAPIRDLSGQTLPFSAVLCDNPRSTGYGVRALAHAELQGKRCYIVLYASALDAHSGDRVEATAYLATPEGEDYERYYRTLGVDLLAYAKGDVTAAPDTGLSASLLRLRRALQEKISAIFPADAAPFVQALLTGDRSGLSFAQSVNLSVSGISHTVAISGMHIAILLGLILLLCGSRRALAALLGIPVVLGYTLLVGAMPSVVRAAVMQSVLLLAPLLRRDYDAPTALGAAALVILVPCPGAAASLSLQLSFGAMAGICLCSTPLLRRVRAISWVQALGKRRLWHGAVTYICGVLVMTLSACVFTMPLIAWQFGLVSLFALVTNLLTLWAVTLVFQLGVAACLLGFVWLTPAKLLAGLLAYLIRYILLVATAITSLPLAAVYTDNVYLIPWIVFLYLLLSCCLLPGGRRLILPASCIAVLSLCLCLWLGYLDAGGFSATLLDVGQGQCLILQDGGATIVYDCGGHGAQTGEDAARALLCRGTARLDCLILSHYDADHAGGVCQLLERMPVALLYLPQLPCDTDLRAEIEQCATAHGVEIRYVTQDETLRFSGTTLRIFAPVATKNENDASLGILCSKGRYDLLATGDMTAQAEMLLLGSHSLPDIEVLVAGHHGASTSTCDALLEVTRPEAVLISVGAGNAYHHPSDETLARILAHGAAVCRTDRCGTITIRN